MNKPFPKSKGFTLIEMLVVIAIIALLAGILAPVVTKAQRKALSVECMSNVRQLAIWGIQYAQRHRGELPHNGKPEGQGGFGTTGSDWFEEVDWQDYGITHGGVMHCPQASKAFPEAESSFHYALSDIMGGRFREGRPGYPQQPPMLGALPSDNPMWFADAHVDVDRDPPDFKKFLDFDEASMPWPWDDSHDRTTHPRRSLNVVFLDGDAESIPLDVYLAWSPETASAKTGQPFPWPHF